MGVVTLAVTGHRSSFAKQILATLIGSHRVTAVTLPVDLCIAFHDTVNEQRDRWPENLTGLEAWVRRPRAPVTVRGQSEQAVLKCSAPDFTGISSRVCEAVTLHCHDRTSDR
jgi:hypothetical protein